MTVTCLRLVGGVYICICAGYWVWGQYECLLLCVGDSVCVCIDISGVGDKG